MEERRVMVGRFNPIHLGHENVIVKMIDQVGIDNCLIVIGSSNADFSLRHFFSYKERRNFIKEIFPKIMVVGLPDYPSDEEWLVALDDILRASGTTPEMATFCGGCEEDIVFFCDAGRKCQIVNRFDGSSPKISATEVRDNLIYKRPLDDCLNQKILKSMRLLFENKWEKFKKI